MNYQTELMMEAIADCLANVDKVAGMEGPRSLVVSARFFQGRDGVPPMAHAVAKVSIAVRGQSGGNIGTKPRLTVKRSNCQPIAVPSDSVQRSLKGGA